MYQDPSSGYLDTFTDDPELLFYLDSNSNLHSTEYDNPYAFAGNLPGGGSSGEEYGTIYVQGEGSTPAEFSAYGIICSLAANTPTVQGVPQDISCAVNGNGGNQWWQCPNDLDDVPFAAGITLQTSGPDGCSAFTVQAVPACSL